MFLQALKEMIENKKFVIKFNRDFLNLKKKVYGVVNMEKKQLVLKLDWETVYEEVSDYIRKQYKEQLIGPKILAKLFDEYNLICFNQNGTTTMFWDKGNKKYCRVINFNVKKIPEIMQVLEKMRPAVYPPSGKY